MMPSGGCEVIQSAVDGLARLVLRDIPLYSGSLETRQLVRMLEGISMLQKMGAWSNVQPNSETTMYGLAFPPGLVEPIFQHVAPGHTQFAFKFLLEAGCRTREL